jgi:cytochrome P450
VREEIRGYQAVREAARDWETYSSNLLGDRDVRDYRQLPLEADPPRHTLFRMALNPVFSPQALAPLSQDFESLATKLIQAAVAKSEFEAVSEVVMPYVIGCLTIIYRRPRDFDEWLSWGPDVWTAAAYQRGEHSAEAELANRNRDFSGGNTRSGVTLQDYLDRVFDEAELRVATGETERDIWDFVAALKIDGTPVTRPEMQGIANVLLAGGRDTVIKLLSGFIWHLMSTPKDLAFITEDAANYRPAIQEMARYLSPLPKMERAPKDQALKPDSERDPERYQLLSFVSANHDAERWQNPDQIDFQRERNAHVAFGFGPHSCLGQNITEIETSAFLSALVPQLPKWRFASEPELAWSDEAMADGTFIRHLDKFKKLPIKISN